MKLSKIVSNISEWNDPHKGSVTIYNEGSFYRARYHIINGDKARRLTKIYKTLEFDMSLRKREGTILSWDEKGRISNRYVNFYNRSENGISSSYLQSI